MPKQHSAQFWEDLVDAIQGLYGKHAGVRAVHAKGIYVKGHFTPAPAATRLSRAAHFAQATPVTGRFSNGSGLPAARDHDPDARGLALKLHLRDGSVTDLVAITIPAFFVRTPEDFVEFTRARHPDPATGKPDPARVGAFVAKHPETARVLGMLGAQAPVASYHQPAYNGIHTFWLENAEKVRTAVRYRLDPVARAWKPEGGEPGPDGYQHDLRARLAAGPVEFDLHYVVAEPGDALDDPTVAWPRERASIVAGRFTLERAEDTRPGPADTMIFDPCNVTDGIACSEDEILHARSAAYGVSYTRRMAK